MIGPPAYAPKRSATGLVCVLIGLASLVFAIAAASAAGDDSRDAAIARDNASGSASRASSSASVAASLPSKADVKARFPLPPGAYTKPDSPASGELSFYFVRGLTAEQVKAFYVRVIPSTFPTLQCRFDITVADLGQACPLRRDVDFGQVDVWSKVGRVNELRPGEIFIRLTVRQ